MVLQMQPSQRPRCSKVSDLPLDVLKPYLCSTLLDHKDWLNLLRTSIALSKWAVACSPILQLDVPVLSSGLPKHGSAALDTVYRALRWRANSNSKPLRLQLCTEACDDDDTDSKAVTGEAVCRIIPLGANWWLQHLIIQV